MATEEATIILKLKDGVNLFVYKRVLVEDSPTFRRLIFEQHQRELEFDDFAPENVAVFITFLQDKKLGEIESEQFREMNKLANVFEVTWMKEDCTRWMEGVIDCANTDDEKEFIFEECMYIIRKWPVDALIESFITRVVPQDNSRFVSQCLTDIDKLDTLRLDHILMIGGCNPEPFLRSIIANLEGKRELSKNMKHLLKNMNLALCYELNEGLYLEVLAKIQNLSGISTEDVKYVFQLSIETMKSISSRKEERKENTAKLHNIIDEYGGIVFSSETLSDIETAISDGKITSMFMVVDVLLKIYYANQPITEDTQMVISTLENICVEGKCNKVSKKYLKMMISALNFSPLSEKVQLIMLLNEIKNNDKLSTCHEIIQINCDNNINVIKIIKVSPTGKKMPTREKREETGKYHFTFRHPYIRECQEPGKCGFVLQDTEQDDGGVKAELCTKSEHYTETGLHVHDIVSARDIDWYNVRSGSTAPDNKIRVVDKCWQWWSYWLPNITDMEYERECVDYNISDYTVFKRK